MKRLEREKRMIHFQCISLENASRAKARRIDLRLKIRAYENKELHSTIWTKYQPDREHFND